MEHPVIYRIDFLFRFPAGVAKINKDVSGLCRIRILELE
jgi:hypothetical protein